MGVQSSFVRPVEYGDPKYPVPTRYPLQVYPASNIDAAKSLLVVRELCFSILFEVQSRSLSAQTSSHDLPLGPRTHIPSFNATEQEINIHYTVNLPKINKVKSLQVAIKI